MEFGYLNKQDYKISQIQENVEFVAYSMIVFLVPFLLAQPQQWIVGTIVNCTLVLAAFNLKWYKVLPIIVLPSIAVFSRGLIFGPFTIFLLYMIPIIWLGNFVLVYFFKKLNYNKWLVLGISAATKTALLFGAAFVLVKLGVLPVLFLTTMGLFQLYTAIAGGIMAFGIQSLKKKFN